MDARAIGEQKIASDNMTESDEAPRQANHGETYLNLPP